HAVRRRQHRLGKSVRGQHRLGQPQARQRGVGQSVRRQHRLGQQRRRRPVVGQLGERNARRALLMEKMPYQPNLESEPMVPPPAGIVETDWRRGLPMLSGERVTLRELRPTDASSLFAMLTTEEVARFISPPPTTVEGFERFIVWTERQRAA